MTQTPRQIDETMRLIVRIVTLIALIVEATFFVNMANYVQSAGQPIVVLSLEYNHLFIYFIGFVVLVATFFTGVTAQWAFNMVNRHVSSYYEKLQRDDYEQWRSSHV
jgi:hypothetical protein